MAKPEKWPQTFRRPPIYRANPRTHAGAAMTHGAYAKTPGALQSRERRVTRLVQRMRELLPYLTEQDVPCCRGWAVAELIGAALFASIMKDGATLKTEGGDIAARRVVNDWRQMKLLQLAYERELGLTPAARATLRASHKGESEFDLVAAMARHIDSAEPGAEQPEAAMASEPASESDKAE